MREEALGRALLHWYDHHARKMPWRTGPVERKAGVRPDPYRVWLSEVMLQQTTVATVRDRFDRFVTRWPTIEALASANDAEVMGEWAGLGYYARARNLLKCSRTIVLNHGGRFPDTRVELLKLPGIGTYTAAAIAAIAFDRSEAVVDGNVERIMARLYAVENPLPEAKVELARLAAAMTPMHRPGDHAQAAMDLGATICTPRNPTCGLCPWHDPCKARRAGIAAELPRTRPKVSKPIRSGIVYLAQRSDGAWLLERRPPKGLLGGMLGWPGSGWDGDERTVPPVCAEWRDIPGEVRHTFTHFHLRLSVKATTVGRSARPARGKFIPRGRFRPSDLPTAMRKAFDLANANREEWMN